MLVYKFWETALNICKKSRDFMCRFLLNTKIRFINFIKNTEKTILSLPIINILVYIIAYFTGKSHIIFKCLAIGLLICVSIFNCIIVTKNKKYFRYKVDNSFLHRLWLLSCNLSRFCVYFGILILLNKLLNTVILRWFGVSNLQELSDALENLFITLFAIFILLHLVNFFTKGLLTGARIISAIFILYLAGFSDIIIFFLGSAGAKLIIDWLFSDNYIEYIKLKYKEDVERINQIKEKMSSIKIKFTADFYFIIFASNLSIIIRKIIPPELKSQILDFMKKFSDRGVESIQDTQTLDRILIGLLTISVSVILYFLLKYFLKNILENTFEN